MMYSSAPGDVIQLDCVTKTYQSGASPALADVSMSVAAGEVVAVMGPSGSGKSTLLNLIAGLDKPSAGTVTVAGRRIDALGESALARFRARHVGIIFQFFNLLDDLTVEDNVQLPAQLAGMSRRQAKARAGQLLERMGIAEQRNAYPARISGGQRQRVAIARALVNSPEVLLADEPTGALDTATGQEIGRLLRELNQDGQTLVLVTHDPDLAERYAARTVRIVDGRVAGVARFRRQQVGMIFQFFNLLDDLTVLDNILLPAQLAGVPRGKARARADELLQALRIGQHRQAYPARLSGGQRQRVAIARALVNRPALLLADEPTGALDSANGEQIGALLLELNRSGQTLVLVTHNPDLAARYASRTIQVADGQIVGAGAGALR